MKNRRFAVTIAFVAAAVAPLVLAQNGAAAPPTPARPGAAPSASASGSASGAFGDSWDKPAGAKPAASAAPTPPPAATAEAETKTEAKTEAKAEVASGTPGEWDPTDVREDPHKRYYFIGARYRGNVVPKFIQNLFVNEGATIYSNTIGLELDSRKEGFSLIPAISYTEYGTDDILFAQKNKPDTANNWSYVNSGLKAIYLTADVLWSTSIAKNVDFEYGLGVGFGFIFGDLVTNWVFDDPNGKLVANSGRHFSPCQTEAQNPSCVKSAHSNAETAHVNGYVEPSWFSGGSRPAVFPWISLPQLGLRFKMRKDLEGRFGLGFALTGFWFGFSANYGFERPEKKDAPAHAGSAPIFRFGDHH